MPNIRTCTPTLPFSRQIFVECWVGLFISQFSRVHLNWKFILHPSSLSLQSKICTWLFADWRGCTCPFHTSFHIEQRWWRSEVWWKIFASHARRSGANYIKSTATVSLSLSASSSHERKRTRKLRRKWKIISIFPFRNFWFPYQPQNFHVIHHMCVVSWETAQPE